MCRVPKLSKIEEYQEKKKIQKKITEEVSRILNKPEDSIKRELKIYHEEIEDGMVITIRFYTPNRGYSYLSPELMTSIVRSIGDKMDEILEDCIKLAAKQTEEKRIEAQEEAKEVLAKTN